MSKAVTFAEGTSSPPSNALSDSSELSSTSQEERSFQKPVITGRPSKRSRPRYRYLLGYFISASTCYERAKARGDLPRSPFAAMVEIIDRLMAVDGIIVCRANFIEVDISLGVGFCFALAKAYRRNLLGTVTVDEDIKRKVKEAVGTDEEPIVIRVPV